jgi:putative ABC transporter-associated repeat protein
MTLHPVRGATRALAGAALALTVLVAPSSSALAAGGPDPDLQQDVDGSEVTSADQAVIESGHVDVGPRFVDGAWQLQARDDRSVPAVWRSASDTVLRVTDAGALPAPDSPAYAFLGTEPGAAVHVVPQVQDPDVVWVGWNTQDPEVVSRIDRGATLTLHGVQGPGDVHVFLQEGVTGAPHPLWSSTAAFPQDLWMDVNTHVHANWVFTAPGAYLLDVEVHADLTDGEHVSDRSVLRFAVGDTTDPQDAMAAALASTGSAPAPAGTTSPADAPPAAAGPQGDAAPPSAGLPAPVVGALIGVATAIALVAVVGSILVTRRRRALVDAEFAGRRPAPSGPGVDDPDAGAR